MSSLTEWIQFLTAMAAAAAAIQSFLNGRRSAKIEKNVQVIHKATNSMKDALIKATRDAALAQGTAAGLEQGRAEDRGS